MLVPVARADDPRLAPFHDLKRGEPLPGTFVVEGEKLLRRLLELRWPLHSILLSERWLPRLAGILPEDVPAYAAPHEAIPAAIGFHFHRGVLACAYRPPAPDLAGLLARGRRLLALPEVADPANLAALIRSAAALGWDGVALGPAAPDPFTRRCLRVSMGAALTLPVARSAAAGALPMVEELRAAGFWTIAAALRPGAEALPEPPANARIALVMGNEDDGLPAAAVSACHAAAAIPMAAGIDSLNVAVAAGILLHRYRPADARD